MPRTTPVNPGHRGLPFPHRSGIGTLPSSRLPGAAGLSLTPLSMVLPGNADPVTELRLARFSGPFHAADAFHCADKFFDRRPLHHKCFGSSVQQDRFIRSVSAVADHA